MSYSRPATPGDKPVNEPFFSRFKADCGEQMPETKNLEVLRQVVIRAIANYNTARYHTSIGCQPPAQFTQQFFNRLTLEGP